MTSSSHRTPVKKVPPKKALAMKVGARQFLALMVLLLSPNKGGKKTVIVSDSDSDVQVVGFSSGASPLIELSTPVKTNEFSLIPLSKTPVNKRKRSLAVVATDSDEDVPSSPCGFLSSRIKGTARETIPSVAAVPLTRAKVKRAKRDVAGHDVTVDPPWWGKARYSLSAYNCLCGGSQG
ncbi:hypothetical protein K439DRAFT_1622565 [Ramaria rubella]|nr:hypothetical protein K439DRAFT_1622565 [Ramaria rubella]